jgi:oligogalacturonide transport system substrate-binding protein
VKRSFKLALAIGLIVVLISGLSVYAAPQTSLRFMWWGGETRHKATMAAIELYMKKNPNVKISGEYGGFSGYQQKLLTQLAGGTAADIIQIDQPWVGDLMSQGDLFLNLYTSKDIKLSEFDRNFLKNQCEWDGKLIGLPTGLNGLAFISNTAFFSRHNIPLNTQWNWDNLIEVGSRINKQSKNNYLLTVSLTHVINMLKMYVAQHNGAQQWVNNDFTPGFDKAALTEALTYYLKLLQNGVIPPLEETILLDLKTEQTPGWISGDIGIAQNWVSSVEQFRIGGKLKLDVTPLPVMKNVKNTGLIVRPSQLMVINKKTSNAREAAKFVNWFFTSPEAAVILESERGIPPTKTGLATLEKNKLIDPVMAKGINLAMKNAGLPENSLSTNKELLTIFQEYIEKVGFKRLTPADAADQMMKSYQSKLAELKAQNK